MTKKYIRYHSDRISSIYYRRTDTLYINRNFNRKRTPHTVLKEG